MWDWVVAGLRCGTGWLLDCDVGLGFCRSAMWDWVVAGLQCGTGWLDCNVGLGFCRTAVWDWVVAGLRCGTWFLPDCDVELGFWTGRADSRQVSSVGIGPLDEVRRLVSPGRYTCMMQDFMIASIILSSHCCPLSLSPSLSLSLSPCCSARFSHQAPLAFRSFPILHQALIKIYTARDSAGGVHGTCKEEKRQEEVNSRRFLPD